MDSIYKTNVTKPITRLTRRGNKSSRLGLGIIGSLTPQPEMSVGHRPALDHLWLKYSGVDNKPKRKEPELESLEKTAERLYANGFCRPYLEPSKMRLKFRRDHKHKSVLPVTDLWGDTQTKRFLIEIGLVTPGGAISNRANQRASTLNCQSTTPLASRVLRSNVESPTAVTGRPMRKSSPMPLEGITLRLDKFMADCIQEKQTVRQSMTNYAAATPHSGELGRTPKGKLMQRELSKISYLMSVL
jgi:hypothetical protein